MRAMRFTLRLSAEEYQRYYQGSAKAVIVTAEDGRTLRFPANALQKFITHEGISGRFEILFDESHKMAGVNRIS